MKLIIIFMICAITLFSSISLFSQPSEEETCTQGWSNGKAWEIFDHQSKINFLVGIESGINLIGNELAIIGALEEENKTYALIKSFTIKGFRFSDIVQQIDSFYQDRSNIRIPIAYAYAFIVRKMSGDNPEDMDTYVSNLRRRWNN